MKGPSTQPPVSLEHRVLLLVATTRDAVITVDLLRQAGVQALACTSAAQLREEMARGVAALLFTEEVILSEHMPEVISRLAVQPKWSDLPVVILMRGLSPSARALDVLRKLTNVTVLERPAPMRSVVSSVQAAVRARERQYEIRRQIDAIRAAEARAMELQQQLTAALDASELGTFSCPFPLGKILWNDRCKAHFWLPPDAEVDFDVFYSIIHPDDRAATRAAVLACVERQAPYDVEYRTVSPTGEIRWIRATGNTTFDPAGRPLSFDGTTRDVTLRRLVEEERDRLLVSERSARIESERSNRLKDEFLATLSHELRTPLNAIFGWVELLKEAPADPALVVEATGVIERNVRMQSQLIEDLLDVSRIISGKVRLDIQPANLGAIIRAAMETVQPAAQAKGVHLEMSVSAGVETIMADPGRLQQVIWNLLSNSVKFTPSGGTVRVGVHRVGPQVEISVVDTGEGVAADFLPRLFERFSQADASPSRRHGGLGLGLSIVKNLVEMHGGQVWAESAGVGHGTAIRIHLPRQMASPDLFPRLEAGTNAPLPPLAQMANLEGLRVLVVDDEPDAREIVRRLLASRGAHPVVAASAEEAGQAIAQDLPQLIVSDIGMPGTDGYQFMRRIRRQGVAIPAMALTAFARAEDRAKSLQAGFQMHLAKPVEPAELLTAVALLAGRTVPA